MSLLPPTFNITCEIWSGPFVGKDLRITLQPCNLAIGRRVVQQYQDDAVAQVAVASLQMTLLLPAGTDLRDAWQGWPNDVIECPSGSGRWYGLVAWDDVGKGFPNEYRLAIITKIGNAVDGTLYPGLFWPSPDPA